MDESYSGSYECLVLSGSSLVCSFIQEVNSGEVYDG